MGFDLWPSPLSPLHLRLPTLVEAKIFCFNRRGLAVSPIALLRIPLDPDSEDPPEPFALFRKRSEVLRWGIERDSTDPPQNAERFLGWMGLPLRRNPHDKCGQTDLSRNLLGTDVCAALFPSAALLSQPGLSPSRKTVDSEANFKRSSQTSENGDRKRQAKG